MAAKRKRAPKLHELSWFMREVLDPGTPVGAVTCVLGRIIMGGAAVYRVVPGTWDVQYRHIPDGVGWPLSVAMEPRPPYRVALGPETGDVIVFTDTTNATSIMGHPFTEQRGSKQAVELAWVAYEGSSSLFARTDDRMLYRMQDEGWHTLEIPPVHAIAQDEEGGFAALTVVDGTPKVYISYDGGASWHLRDLGVEVEAEPNAPARMALAGDSVAIVVGDSGPILSRGPGAVTAQYGGLVHAHTLAFQGMAPDAWLYVGTQRSVNHLKPGEYPPPFPTFREPPPPGSPTTEEVPGAVWLIADGTSPIKVMDFLADDHQPLELGYVAWDSTRGALMVPSRSGLIAMGPESGPGAKGRAKPKPEKKRAAAPPPVEAPAKPKRTRSKKPQLQ
jgi:hypothetical protein